MTWRADVWAAVMAGRPMEAYVSVANPTLALMDVAVRLAFSTGTARTQRATVAVGETWGAKVRALFGSRASDTGATLTGLTVTCNGGTVACPVSFVWMTAPGCVLP